MFVDLPREIFDLIFNYLTSEHLAYAFLELHPRLNSIVIDFIGERLTLVEINDEKLRQFCFSTFLSSIGFQLRYLSLNVSSSFLPSIQFYCPNLETLTIDCRLNEDIRRYVTFLLHDRILSLTLKFNRKIVGEEISTRLIRHFKDEEGRSIFLARRIVLLLRSIDDLVVLERFSFSDYLSDGFYLIQNVSTGQWLSESENDLCLSSDRFSRKTIFSIRCSTIDREYHLINEISQRRLTVLKPDENEDERWISSSILSIHRQESTRTSSSFTFEKIDNENEFHIRPSYVAAKRLQVCGKRTILSLCQYQNTAEHRFKLHRISSFNK